MNTSWRLVVMLALGACGVAAETGGEPVQANTPSPIAASVPGPTNVAEAGPPEPSAAQREAMVEAAARSPIKRDEHVQLFPTSAWLDEGAGVWRVPIHGWIYEPEESDLKRGALVAGLREALDDDPRVASARFDARVRPFLVDNERGKAVSVTVAGEVVQLAESGADGMFTGEAAVAEAIAARWAVDGRLNVEVITPRGDRRKFATQAHLVPLTGLTIVSDVDDTVKITDVRDKRALLENTFLEPFRAVDDMASTYRTWLSSAPGGHLHFVSSSPWQLYPDLREMIHDAGFPAPTWSLKAVRPKSLQALDLFADPLSTKPPTIAAILERYPARRFVLVGDSGEKDPEIYGVIARRFPDQVAYIAIRNVTAEDAGAPRYAEAFRGVEAPWEVFTEPKTLAGPHASPP